MWFTGCESSSGLHSAVRAGCSGWIFLSMAASSTGAAAGGHHISQFSVACSKSCSFTTHYKPLKTRELVIQRTTPKFSSRNFSGVWTRTFCESIGFVTKKKKKKISLFHKKNVKGNTSIDNVILKNVFNAWETFLTKPCSREVEKSWYPWGTRIGWDLVGSLYPILTVEDFSIAAEGSHIKARCFSVLVPTLPWLAPHTKLIFLLHSVLYDALPSRTT